MEESSIPDTPESQYRKEVFDAPLDQLSLMLQEVADAIIPPKESGFQQILQDGMNLFSVSDNSDLQYDVFMKNYYKALHKVVVLHHRFAEEGLLLESEGEECIKNLIVFNKLFEIFHYWEQAIRSIWYVRKASNPLYDSSLNTDIGLFRFKPIDPDENNCFQNLILYLLTILAKRGWRRQDDQCMERIYTTDGYDTHAWKPVMDIKTFVYSVTQMDVNYQHWYNLTQNPSNASNSIKYLTNVCDLHFIDVEKDRKLFSFTNGIYETSLRNEETGEYYDRWYPHCKTHNDSETGYISYDICPKRSACKYFDLPFDNYQEYDDWYDIPTPIFQSILDYQEFPEDVCRWMYILLCGRLLHEVGDLDEWQVMPFLKGKAKTGKCFAKDTPIMMADGSLRMVQTIVDGELVMGDDWNPRRVLSTTEGVDKMYRVEQSKGDNYTVNSQHILSLKVTTDIVIGESAYRCGDVIDIPVMDYLGLGDSVRPTLKGFKAGSKESDYSDIRVVELGRDNYYGFQLDGNQRLLLGDGTVTHNSTILTRVSKQFFHALDVGVISNNIEVKFGLSAISNKKLFIAPEISDKFKMDQCDFQTIISGEDTSVAEKNKTAKSVKWPVPGAMAGNKSPGYTDNQGSISRRLVVFLFKNKVRNGDTQLGNKLLKEIPTLIKKGNMAYLDAINKYGKKDIWVVLPKYFKDTQDLEAEQTNVLVAFLKSGLVEFNKDDPTNYYCSHKSFMACINDFTKENNLNRFVWKKDQYESVFEEFDISYSQKIPKKEREKGTRTRSWIYGVRILREDNEEVDDLED